MSQLQILKLNLQVFNKRDKTLENTNITFYQEKKINKNDYMEESESIWKAMKEVQNCEILSSS